MSSVFLDANDQFTVANSGKIFGASADESIIIQTNISDVIIDQNIERIEFPLKSSDYTYQQTGNVLLTFLDQTLIATIPLQSDGSQIEFTDTSVLATLSTGIMSMGGVTVPTDTAKSLIFTNGDNTSGNTNSFTLSATPITADEGQTQTYTLTSSLTNTQPLSLNYLIVPSGDNPASAIDFTSATSGTLTLAANTTNATLSIDIKQDDIDEFAESFSVIVKDNTGKIIATSESIINNIKTADLTAPIITTSSSTIKYTENQQANTLLTTITASDNIAVDQLSIISGNAEGFFSINSQGEIRLSTLGLQGASNDFEVLPNNFLLGIRATDTANNISNTATVSFIVEDDISDNSSNTTSAVFTLSRSSNASEALEDFIGIMLIENDLNFV